MPFMRSPDYHPRFPFNDGHVQTIYPNLVRKVGGIRYQRHCIDTPDGDFLDLDYSRHGFERLAVVAHGLEGDSFRPYVLGMVRALNRRGWDAVAWNFRGCSGRSNRTLRLYHSGNSDDLRTVVTHVLDRGEYQTIALIGFSLGGNVVLKYLGEEGRNIHPSIKAAAALSVPCDLTSGACRMSRPENFIYTYRFLRLLHRKIRLKMKQFPGRIDDSGFHLIRTFKDFDDRYTAPLHGFDNAQDYWNKASSKPFLKRIRIPTLLVDAINDPFLPEPCYPIDEARDNPFLFLDVPDHGGHVGFVSFNAAGEYWSERRVARFLNASG